MKKGSTIAQVATECLRKPKQHSVWSHEHGKYIGLDPKEVTTSDLASIRQPVASPDTPPPLSSLFKLVFVTATVGTFLFILICVVVTMASGGELASAEEKLVQGLFDLAKIGFGSVVGLLGSKSL